MSGPARLLLLVELALIAFLYARARAIGGPARGRTPRQSGWYVVAWTTLPAAAFLIVWAIVAPALVTQTVLASPAATGLPDAAFARAAALAQARDGIDLWNPAAAALAPVYAAAQARFDWIATAAMLLLAAAGCMLAMRRLARGVAPRPVIERLVETLLALAALTAILITAAIVLSLLWQTGRFFAQVSPLDFLFGTHWSPQTIDPADPGAMLGALPLFWGTFLIGAVIAMLVAVPLGLLSAIFLTQYASPATRRWLKPTLEVLAGVPTVVYGLVAALYVAPAVRVLGAMLGNDNASGESALAAGLVMGVMIIPYVSSTSDDALAAVPAELRDGSLAMGATVAETVRYVLLPAALPGVIGGVLLAVSRAVGETMIAVMAASAVATLTLDPFAPATTVTRQIVDLLTGEAVFDSPKTLAAFALGLTLFALTLALNLVALRTVRRFRLAYD
jgi:phosphate transport system permease protein